jgi:hypothetical protein
MRQLSSPLNPPILGDFRAFQSPPELGDLGGGSGHYFIATPLAQFPKYIEEIQEYLDSQEKTND